MSKQAKVRSSLRRGRKPRPQVRAASLIGRKYLRLLEGYLSDLRARYAHPNRVLFYDDVVIVYLLAFFNTSLRSLRGLEDASQLPGVRQHLSVEAVCKSTLSDANKLFDPQLLEGLIDRLRQDLPDLPGQNPELGELLAQVQIVDGSFFRLAGDVAWALHSTRSNGKPLGEVRLNCQWCLRTGVPSGISINGRDGIGEAAAAEQLLEPGALYLFDAGFMRFAYLKKLLCNTCGFLGSLAVHVNFQAREVRALSPEAQAAGVLSDTLGHLTGSDGYEPPRELLREVKVAFVDREGKPRTLRLLTSLLDLPTHLVAELYRYRWQIELFFRWLKVSANFETLSSQSRNGVTLNFHIAVIACLLTSLHTQQGLSKYSHQLLGMIAAGQAELEDVLPILQHREWERQRERRRQAAKHAAKLAAVKN